MSDASIQKGSSSLVEDLFENAPIPTAVVSPLDILVHVNAAYCSFLGYPEAELVGKTVQDVTYPADWLASQDAIRKLKSDGVPIQRMEKRCLHKTGKLLWAEVNARKILDENGAYLYSIAQLVDITERKEIQDSLRESEERFRRILEQSPMSMAIVSLEGVIEYINKKAVETFGYSHADIPNMDCWWKLAYPDEDYRAKVVARWMGRVGEAIANHREIAGDEYLITCKDGTVKTMFVFGVPVSSKVFVMFNDITERKRIQASLEESQERLALILELSPMPMAIVGRGGVIEFINKKVVEITGYTLEDIPTLGRWWALAYPEAAYRKKVIDEITSRQGDILADTNGCHGGEYEVTCKDGTVKTMAVSRVLVADKVLIMFNDITERVRLQKNLEQSREELELKVKDRTVRLRELTGEMIRVEHRERRRIAHVLHEDLQQWLAAAKFRVGELQAGFASPGDRQATEKILDMLDKSIEVVRGLSVGLSPPVLYELGPKAIMEWLAHDMDQKFGLDVGVRVDPRIKVVSEEMTLFIFDAVRELLMNVVKHAGTKAAMIGLFQAEDDFVEVEVWDEGVGFDPTERGGRKFGLFSIWERADALGGRLDIQSKPGQGSSITLKLPQREPDTVKDEAPSPPGL